MLQPSHLHPNHRKDEGIKRGTPFPFSELCIISNYIHSIDQNLVTWTGFRWGPAKDGYPVVLAPSIRETLLSPVE